MIARNYLPWPDYWTFTGDLPTTVVAMLLRASYTFSAEHTFVSNISTHQVVATGYARKTKLLTPYSEQYTKARTDNILRHLVKGDWNLGKFTATGSNAPRSAAFYSEVTTGGDAARRLLFWWDFESAITVTNQFFVLAPDAVEGLIRTIIDPAAVAA